MNAEKKNVFGIITVILIVAIAVFAVATSFVTVFSRIGVSDPMTPSAIMDFSAGWKNENGIVMSINGMLDTGTKLSPDRPMLIRKSFDGIDLGEMLYIHSRNLVINIYADEEPLYITAENGHESGMEGFDNYIMVGLPSHQSYQNLELRVFSTEYSDSFGISSILVGPEKNIIRKLLGESILSMISGVIFIVVGTGLIVFGVSTRKKVESYLSSFYYGIFLVFIALGMIYDTSWAHIVFNNVVFAETSQRIFLSASLPVFLAFVDTFFVTEHVYPVKILTIVSAVVFPVILFLNSTGIATFITIAVYFLIFEAVCGLVVLEELLVFMIKTRGAKSTRKRRDYFAAFVFIGCVLMDIVIFISLPVGNDDLFFTRAGLFVLSAVTIISWFSEILDMIKLGVQAGRIGKIAFTDANTGIGNVAAFRAEFDDLEARKYGYKYIGIVQFDVNNLKIINDTKGHEAGDLLIKSAADIINNSFGAAGNCYRTGGDEFVALITSDHAPIVCEEAIYNFNKLIDKFNAKEDKPFELRIAYGIAYYQNEKNVGTSLKDIHKIADERMYENKKMLKVRYARSPEEAIIR